MKVRLSAVLRQQIEEAARRNNRTMNAEIVSRLETSFAGNVPASEGNLPGRMTVMENELEDLRLEVRRLANKLPRD